MNIFVSELLGTFLLVAIILATTNPVYIAIGFLVAILVSNVSKGHINPVVSLVRYLQGSITQPEVFQYLCGQVSGALLALLAFQKFDLKK
jgi:glycerol uptake facilitator-like aquaporin